MEEVIREQLSTVSSFHLPPIHCSLPKECHPNFASHVRAADDWVISEMGLSKKKVVQSRVFLYSPMTVPKGTHDDRMIFLCKHDWVFFVFDDMLEDNECAAEMKSEAMQVAQGSYPSSLADESFAPIWLLFEDFLCQIRNQMDPYLFSRYLGCLSRFMDGVADEIHSRKFGFIMDASYRIVRRKTSYMEACAVVFGQFCMGLDLQPSEVECTEYANLLNAVLDHIMLVNDIFSFRKERFEVGMCYNWMTVLMYHRKISFQQAIYTICDMIQEEERNILVFQEALLRKAALTKSEDLTRSANAYRWKISSGRTCADVTMGTTTPG